jgi:hypothetical protein
MPLLPQTGEWIGAQLQGRLGAAVKLSQNLLLQLISPAWQLHKLQSSIQDWPCSVKAHFELKITRKLNCDTHQTCEIPSDTGPKSNMAAAHTVQQLPW